MNQAPTTITRPASGGLGALETIQVPEAGFSEVRGWGEVKVTNGDTEFRARNKVVGNGLKHIINMIHQWDTSAVPQGRFQTNDPTYSWIYVGRGTGATLESMNGLVDPITTKPNSTSVTVSNPGAGVYNFKFTAVWNSGALAAEDIEEIGIFGYLYTDINDLAPTAGAMYARLSTTDTEFTAFTINTSAPLTIEYTFTLTFA